MKKELLEQVTDLLIKTATADDANMLFYYDDGERRYIAGRGSLNDYRRMLREMHKAAVYRHSNEAAVLLTACEGFHH